MAAAGDVVLTNHGSFNVSGAAFMTAANLINLGQLQVSGGEIFIIPIGEGQVQLFSNQPLQW